MPVAVFRSCRRLVLGLGLAGAFFGLAADGAALPQGAVTGAGQAGGAAKPAARHVGAAKATPAPRDARMDWWREARFGMFVHFGLYAVPAGEWNGRTDYGEWIRHTGKIPLDVYDGFRARFNPTGFDAGEWARMAKRAGMRYLVITTKHHDGFALFDSKQSDFTVMATPFRRDLLREVVDAFRREGLRIGFYHSIMDWHHPDYLPRRDWERDRPADGADMDRYVAYLKAQLKELLTNYGPIDVLWFDGQWESTWTNDRGKDLYAYVRALQPQIIVNNRVGRNGGDFGLKATQERIGDFGTPEQEIPATGLSGLDWETCMTMNKNWGYNRADQAFKPTEDLVRNLVDIASKGGNFLLNIGPKADGRFPQESIDRLQAIGAWMDVNGESIRGTEASPFEKLAWGRCTRKPLPGGVTRLYLHVFDWPADGRIVVEGLLNLPRRAYLLSDGTEKALETTRRGDDLVIAGPVAAPDKIDSVVVLEVNGRADVVKPPVLEAASDIFIDQLPVTVKVDRDHVRLRYTTDSTPPTDESPVVRGPIVLTATSAITVQAFRNGRAVSPAVSRTFRKVPARPAVPVSDVVPGLRYQCLEGEFSLLPDFEQAKPAASGEAATFDAAKRTRDARFALRFQGYVRVPKDGVYTFSLQSDDGSRLWIDDALLVDNDGPHSAREVSGATALAAGFHRMTVAMFQQDGGFDLAVTWAGPGIVRQPIPASVLFRDR